MNIKLINLNFISNQSRKRMYLKSSYNPLKINRNQDSPIIFLLDYKSNRILQVLVQVKQMKNNKEKLREQLIPLPLWD